MGSARLLSFPSFCVRVRTLPSGAAALAGPGCLAFPLGIYHIPHFRCNMSPLFIGIFRTVVVPLHDSMTPVF